MYRNLDQDFLGFALAFFEVWICGPNFQAPLTLLDCVGMDSTFSIWIVVFNFQAHHLFLISVQEGYLKVRT